MNAANATRDSAPILSQLRGAPWTSVFPGLAIAGLVLGFNALGEGIRKRVDPKSIQG